MPRLCTLLALALIATPAVAADWPQWLGPNRDGSTTDKVAPWKDKLKVLWKQPVGDGHGGPIVADGKVYLLTADPKKEIERVQSFDAVSGNPLQSFEYERPVFKPIFGRGPRGTPSVSGGKLYSIGATGILNCIDLTTMQRVWGADFKKDFKAPDLKFGVSTSPLVVGDLVLANVGAKGASVVAFHKDKGDVVWKKLDDGASYSSPILMGEGKAQQAVFLTQQGVIGVRVADGELQWRHPFEDTLFESSTTPVVVLGGKVLASSITLGTALLDLSKDGGKTKAKEEWFTKELKCYFSTPTVVGDQIYLVSGSLGLLTKAAANLHCVDAKSGKELWNKQSVGKYHASLMRTGDNKLLMVEEAGNLVLLEPNAKEYRELCRSKICGNTWAHPAVSNGKLYIRDAKELVCVELPSTP